MIPTPTINLALVVCASFAVSVSAWSLIRTDDAAWKAACGRQERVGAVCISTRWGSPSKFTVQDNAQQNVAFSGDGKALLAYCPNLDKGEKQYDLQYASGDTDVYYRIVGRHSGARCCDTKYIDPSTNAVVSQCVSPTVGTADIFPSPSGVP